MYKRQDEPVHIEIFPVAATAVTPIVSVAAINKGNIFFFDLIVVCFLSVSAKSSFA